jgi:hypothetical protein
MESTPLNFFSATALAMKWAIGSNRVMHSKIKQIHRRHSTPLSKLLIIGKIEVKPLLLPRRDSNAA